MVYSYKNSFIEIIPKYLLQVATHCETKDGDRAHCILWPSLQDSANGSYEEIRISFQGNRPGAGHIFVAYALGQRHGASRTKPRIQRRNYPNEKTGHGNYQHYATAGEIPGGDCLGAGDLSEHSPLSYPPPPGTGRWQTLQKLRKADYSTVGKKRKAVLFGQMPYGLVEQPPGAGSEESILSHHL